jgi:protein O-GlcNAc transferase
MNSSSEAAHSQPGSAERVQALFKEALICQRRGQIAEAKNLYLQILGESPRHAPSLHLLGSMALQAGAVQQACELIGKSVEADPTVAEAHLDLANALRLAGSTDRALASYDRALELKRDLMEAHFNRGVVLQELQRLGEALDCYERAVKSQPNFVPALFNRAVLLAALSRPQESLSAYDRCLMNAPAHIEALSNRGVLLLKLGRLEDALQSFERALSLAPASPKILNNRGSALHRLHRLNEAVASFDAAIALDASSFEALRNRGASLRKLGLADAALVSIDSALALRSDPAAMLDRAEILVDLKRYPEAIACLNQLLALAPRTDYAAGLRLHLKGLVCDWEDYQAQALELRAAVEAGSRADYPFPFLAVTDSAASQARCAQSFAEDKFPAAASPLWRGKRYRHAKIRVAYVSADLREHPVSALLAGVFEKHDRGRFEIIAISLRPAEQSSMGQRIRAAFDSFVDVSRMSDRDAASLVRERQIDIAVDLMGYTQGSRTAILAHRPAPIQVNYLGYPGSMGASYMDYLLADEFLIPAAQRRHYREKVIWLPECFQANDDQRAVTGAPPRRQFGLPELGLVYCCFNNHYKINPQCFAIWMRLLRHVPGSILWLVAEERAVRENLEKAAANSDVDSKRLIFAPRIAYNDHLARLRCADLFLDTLPFNGGATASDALWAGVPVVTCAGEALAARMAGSLLTSAGLPELITQDLAQYEALALSLATTPGLLADYRARLERNRRVSPLFDSERFCRHLESAYVSMWQRSESGTPPESFSVPALSRAS